MVKVVYERSVMIHDNCVMMSGLFGPCKIRGTVTPLYPDQMELVVRAVMAGFRLTHFVKPSPQGIGCVAAQLYELKHAAD